jgi:hypothetical protein
VARVAEWDAVALLNPRGTLAEAPDEARKGILARWPAEPYRVEGLALPYGRDGRAARALVALVEALAGWHVPALLDYGYWNDCPEPAVYGAVLRYWGDQYGAELVCMTETGLEVALTRPPRTRLTRAASCQLARVLSRSRWWPRPACRRSLGLGVTPIMR